VFGYFVEILHFMLISGCVRPLCRNVTFHVDFRVCLATL